MQSILGTLQTYIEEEIIPKYEHFDKAHQKEHVTTVIKESLELSQFYNVNLAMVYTIAAFHDLGLSEGRKYHHLASANILREDKRLHEWFNEKEIQIMAEAVEDHRASNQHSPRSIYGMIVAEADRYIHPSTILLRTVQYGISHYPELDKVQQYQRFCDHLQEKYAEGGYLKLWIPQSANSIRLSELRKIISDKDELKKQFDSFYNKEKYI